MLTDPTFIHMHEQVPLGYGLHTTRLTNPTIDIGELLALVQLAVGQAPGTRDKTELGQIHRGEQFAIFILSPIGSHGICSFIFKCVRHV
jgi:hypothetical protein